MIEGVNLWSHAWLNIFFRWMALHVFLLLCVILAILFYPHA